MYIKLSSLLSLFFTESYLLCRCFIFSVHVSQYICFNTATIVSLFTFQRLSYRIIVMTYHTITVIVIHPILVIVLSHKFSLHWRCTMLVHLRLKIYVCLSNTGRHSNNVITRDNIRLTTCTISALFNILFFTLRNFPLLKPSARVVSLYLYRNASIFVEFWLVGMLY